MMTKLFVVKKTFTGLDFSSAFNTLQPRILISKLIELKVNPFVLNGSIHF